jgi:hypothetical protein
VFKQQQVATSQLNYKMETTGKSKSKSGLGKSSGIKRMNKKEASEWFQGLSPAEQSLLKQEKNSSSSSNEKKKTKKEMHERERELILKRQSEHEARMKAQLKSRAEITQQIQKCRELRSRLIPLQMRLNQMKMHASHNTYHRYTQTSNFYFKLGNLEAKVSNELRLIQNEEKVLFDMHHKHHCIKNSIKDIIAKITAIPNPYTRFQAKKYVDNIYNLVTV